MKNPNINTEEMPDISPYIMVEDVDKAIAFYQLAFNFELSGTPYLNDDGRTVFAAMRYKNSLIMLGEIGALRAPKHTPKTLNADATVQLHLHVTSSDAAFQKAIDAGAIAIYPPEDKSWGERVGKVKDLDGHFWCLASSL